LAYAWIIDPPSAIEDYESPTVIRLRVGITVNNRSASTNSSGFVGVGVYVASGDQDSIAVPDPAWDAVQDRDSDWLYRWVAPIPSYTASGVAHLNGGADSNIESKAKRKIPRGSGLLACFEVTGLDILVDVVADFRALIISG
jgi:hypothetical protein